MERLSVIIANRMSGFIKKTDFKIQLGLPLEKNGAGLDKIEIHKLTRYLEKLIAQGVHAGAKGAHH